MSPNGSRQEVATLPQVLEQGAEFALGIFMDWVDRELQCGFQNGTGLGAAVLGEEEFAEEDARHYQVGFLRDAKFVGGDCRHRPALGDQRLGEAEAEEFVAGSAGDASIALRTEGRH